MNRTVLATLTALLMLTTGLATATAASVAPVGPVTNGDFEIGIPGEALQPLRGTPADQCIGIGHQVQWGQDSPLGALTGSHALGIVDDPDNADPSAERVADRYTDDGSPDTGQAQADAEEQAGYGHCEFSPEDGRDLKWLNPAREGGPAFWSQNDEGESAADLGFEHDDNPFDREILVEADATKKSHNFWQNILSQGREPAYTANFDAFEFDFENHDEASIPSSASVDISLNPFGLEDQESLDPSLIECSISFSGDVLSQNLDANTGRVSVDSLLANYNPGGDCPDDPDQEDLGRLRIAQLSFWRFNQGDDPVVIDNIEIAGATTAAEEVASGNVNTGS